MHQLKKFKLIISYNYKINHTTVKKNLLCNLGKWNVANQSVDQIVSFKGRAQFVAISKDGTPWTTCAPSNDFNVYRGRN